MAGTQKILVVRMGRAGDMVMITPPLRALLDALPDAEFHLLTGAEGARVLRGFDPRLTRCHLYSRRFPRSWIMQRSLLADLRREGFARAYILETRPFYRHWLATVAPEVHALPSGPSHGHYCDQCLDLVQASVDRPIDAGWVNLAVTDDGRARARDLLSDHGIDPRSVLVGLHPTFSGSDLPFFRNRDEQRHRHWPAEHFGAVARRLQAQAEAAGVTLAVLVDALPEERRLVEPLVAASGGAITLLCAPPDFERYKALLAGLDLLITPNTGPMHIGAAVGTPLVALFSRWSPDDCGPYMDPFRRVILRAEDTATPSRGLAAITPDDVAEAAWGLLSRTGALELDPEGAP